MSLKSKLQEYIKSKSPSSVSLDEIAFICRQEGRKLSNAERRLRSSESPMVEPIMKNNAIIAYRWRESMPISIQGITAKEFMEKYPSKKVDNSTPIEENVLF